MARKMTFEDLRNEVAEAVRDKNKDLPFGEVVSFEKLPVVVNGKPVKSFELVKRMDGGYRLRLNI